MLPPPESFRETEGGDRYGIVLAVALATVVFLIVAPESSWSRAIGLLLSGGMLLTVVVTSRGNVELRKRAGLLLALGTLVVFAAIGLEWIPQGIGAALSGALVLITLVQLVRGLAVLLRVRGVTVPAVAGALGVYLLVGIVFAFVISTMAKLGPGPYFAQGTDGSQSQRVYFSFTSMTTTGYGDLSPATRGGRAVAVLEMLTGQIYLVTVISLLVGNLRRRRDG
ncbi:MAG: two pore domain potassium channel family protein [Actinobacteria bacterium]|nr:two pore domain potassium channel family protein [Actinomycetota bacterium]